MYFIDFASSFCPRRHLSSGYQLSHTPNFMSGFLYILALTP